MEKSYKSASLCEYIMVIKYFIPYSQQFQKKFLLRKVYLLIVCVYIFIYVSLRTSKSISIFHYKISDGETPVLELGECGVPFY